MALDTTTALGALTGQGYRARLDDGREVWLKGRRIEVTASPGYAGLLDELCRLYDLQHRRPEEMTFVSQESGRRLSGCYLLPRTAEELQARRRNADILAEESWGLLAANHDYLASMVVGLYEVREELDAANARLRGNVERYYRYAAEHDLPVAHAVQDPYETRLGLYPGSPPLTARAVQTVRETADGIVVRGALPLVPLAPLACELLVCGAPSIEPPDASFVQWFAVPMNAPGLKLLANEPRSAHAEDAGHYFARHYDEPDAAVIFDDVLVPWERVFLLGDAALARRLADRVRAWPLYSANLRLPHYLRTLVGVTTLLAEAMGVDGLRGMRDRMGEMTIYPELFHAAVMGAEIEASLSPGGLLTPAPSLALAAYAEQYSRRLLDLMREVAGAGPVMQPAEEDLRSTELRPYIDQFLRNRNMDAAESARLFRIAWDLVGDGAGTRKELYERWLRGDPATIKNRLFTQYDRTHLNERILNMISRPLPQGETPPVWDLLEGGRGIPSPSGRRWSEPVEGG